MRACRYLIRLNEGDWPDAHFELRRSDQERLAHVVVRRAAGRLGINFMQDGTWGEEVSFPLPDAPEDLGLILVDVVRDRVAVTLQDQIFPFRMKASRDDLTLHVAAKNLTWQLQAIEPEAALAREGANPEGAAIREIRLLGEQLRLPQNMPRKRIGAMMHASTGGAQTYVAYLCSRALGGEITVIDLDPAEPVNAILAARLLPRARICVLCEAPDDARLVGAISRENGLDRLQTISLREARALLAAPGDGQILLQGTDVFGKLGTEIDAMPSARRAGLHLFSNEARIVPGNRVFPCASARISVGPDWCLNHETAPAARRPGLDVAIAAYNARDYLLDCTRSLLCKGRDDIRVIVVDDGSSDGCGNLVAEHFGNDPRVRVVRKPNGGCASARNYGQICSDASHIAFVDADDFVTENFFADLYDLALYTGHEVVQGGYDTFDETRRDVYLPSYEDTDFAAYPRRDFAGQPVIEIKSRALIKSQPSIWRRVYRRDFLEAEAATFPENVRAYDDYIFQMVTLTAAGRLFSMPEHRYHYRQHPSQDIKQGDERHFHMIHMFHMLLRRSVSEGWEDFRPYCESVVDCINWSTEILRPDLITAFLAAGARACVAIAKVHGAQLFDAELMARVQHPDFRYHYERESAALAHIEDGLFWAQVLPHDYHPDMIRMRQKMLRAT